LQRYLKVYDNVLDKDTCERMISLFDSKEDQHEIYNDDLMNFNQINLIQHKDDWSEFNSILSIKFQELLEQYKSDCHIHVPLQWPEKYSFEEFRIKRYEPNEGKFDYHTDVNDYNSAIRFLAFFIYLNDSDDYADGGTEFPKLGLTSPRKQGACLVFPPLWMYPHAGLVSTNRKYIVGSYLHYLKDNNAR